MSCGSARRVLGRVVERGEVVVVVLDLGALDDREAEPDEDVLHLAPDLRDQVQVADRHAAGRRAASRRRGPRPGRRSSSAASSSAVRSLEQRLQRLAHLVGLLARPGRAARPAARRSSAAPGSAPTCGPGSAPAAPRARRRSRRRPRRPRPRCAAGPGQPWAGASAQASRGHPIPASYSATVAAIATLSDSGPSTQRMRTVAGLAARRAGPRARRPGRAPAARSSSTSPQRAARRARSSATRAPVELLEHRPRRRPREHRPHARPHRLGRERVGAARARGSPGRPRARAPRG